MLLVGLEVLREQPVQQQVEAVELQAPQVQLLMVVLDNQEAQVVQQVMLELME